MKKILITGANSYIGTSFEKYINDNYSNDYQIDTVDMLDGSWRQKEFSEYDSVFHVAGIAHSDNGKISKEKEKLYYSVNTDLTVETAKKAKAEGVKQFIFMSSAIVYGDSAPIGKTKLITKETPVAPANCYGDSKVQAEKGLFELADDNFKVVIVRPPMIYGKGSKGNYPLLAKIASKMPIFPFVKNERSMLYIENLCEFIYLMIKNEESGIFWPQNAEYSNTSELVKMISDVRGKKLKLIRGFESFVKMAGHLTGLANKAFGNMCYDKELSEYKEEYRKFSLKDSIRKTED
ncbi:MAG: NAD-dependent epimerase/dehydratase family protein [Clostridia bacterium]|nr:NAD-dependent epimerase/dehydratase family protein [Clostridia bacterium]